MISQARTKINEALSDEGPIGKIAGKIEKVTKLKRELAAIGFYCVVASFAFLQIIGLRTVNIVLYLWSIIGSLRSADVAPSTMHTWLAFWIFFVIINHYIEPFLDNLIPYMYPFVKMLMYAIIAFPADSGGAMKIYNKILKNKIFKSDGIVAAAQQLQGQPTQQSSTKTKKNGEKKKSGDVKQGKPRK